MITGKGISKTFTGQPVLQNITFRIGNNHKIGIVGRNGCGKTTLFNIITKNLEPDDGSLQVQQERIGYIPQEFSFGDELVGEYLEKKLEDPNVTYKIDILVNQLEFANYDPYQEIKTLSEGQKMKLKIIETMLDDPTTLLIDEPTNHLDIEGIMWFEDYIKKLDKTVVMISHDREFLNNTVDEIWEIENNGILRFVGDYDNYKEEKLKLIDKWDEEYVRFLAHKRKLDKLLENVRKINDGKARGKAVRAAKKRIEREVEQNKKEKYEDKKMREVNFDTDITHSKLMVRFDGVGKNFGENTVLEDLSFEIRGSQKVWLLGPNGTGKTTLVKMLMGEETPSAGEIKIGTNIKIGYFAQKQTQLDYDMNIFDHFKRETGCYAGSVYGVLEKFLFDRDSLKKRVRDLSPGQRARFAFAIFAYKNYDLLVLDEPTNHLDIETKEAIENSLREFKGTLLLVSHDRFFVERVGMTHMLRLPEGVLEMY